MKAAVARKRDADEVSRLLSAHNSSVMSVVPRAHDRSVHGRDDSADSTNDGHGIAPEEQREIDEVTRLMNAHRNEINAQSEASTAQQENVAYDSVTVPVSQRNEASTGAINAGEGSPFGAKQEFEGGTFSEQPSSWGGVKGRAYSEVSGANLNPESIKLIQSGGACSCIALFASSNNCC